MRSKEERMATSTTQLKKNSPYTAGMTGCGFMLDEFNAVLPLLMSENSKDLLKKEVEEGTLTGIAAKTSRDRTISEFKRRFHSMPDTFWSGYLDLSDSAMVLAMFFVMLKTYLLYFDFQADVVKKKWESFSQTVSKSDIEGEINNIACQDEFVDSWSDNTRDKIASAFMAVLRKVGFLDENSEQLKQPTFSDVDFIKVFEIGAESWLLDMMLLEPYRITDIINRVTK